ncbi:MAG TPA: hypothetical protein VFJ12_07080 [Segeticoccus sp.]|jgi:hypothetical protein|nr:hypothetical protein [Segeticoccus sp.]
MTRRVLVAAGAVAVVAAAVLLLAPIGADGVSGNAISPLYHDFGWFAYAPLPEHATFDQLRAAGVRVPQDAVATRRREAAAAALVGVALLSAPLVLGRLRRHQTPHR